MANPHQSTRDGKGRYNRNSETAARDAQAARLRDQGWTFQQIADELGLADKKGAQRAVRRAISEVIQGPAEQLLKSHMERLETIFDRCMAIADAEHVTVSHGKVITMEDPETGEEKPLRDNGPTLAALREARAALESFRRLTGMDKPVKVDATLTEVTQQDLELQEMLREAKARSAAEEQRIREGGEA